MRFTAVYVMRLEEGVRISSEFFLVLVKEAVRRMRNNSNFLSEVDEGAENDDSEAIPSLTKAFP